MLSSLDDYLHTKKKELHDSFFLDTDDQRILQSDWIRGKTGRNQPKELISHPTSPGLSPCKNQRGQMILFRGIDDQRILRSDWMRDTTGLTQLKVAVSDAAKKTKTSLDSFQRYR